MNKFQKIPIDKIIIGDRIRKDHGNMDFFVQTILLVGLIEPIAVKSKSDGRYLLLAGRIRILAHESLGLKEIYAHIVNGDE